MPKHLTRRQIDAYYGQAEAHLEPQRLQMHLRELLAGGREKLPAADQEAALLLSQAHERLLLDWEQTRSLAGEGEGETDAGRGT